MSEMIQMERIISEGVPNAHRSRVAISLRGAFNEPFTLDIDRTPMFYGRLEVQRGRDMDKWARRMLVAAIDRIRFMGNLNDTLTLEDKICLLRNCFAPLTVLELCAHMAEVIGNPMELYFPNGSSMSFDTIQFSGCFITTKIVSSMLDELARPLRSVQMDNVEMSLLKAIIVLNPDASGLSPTAVETVSAFRDRIHTALNQHCCAAQQDNLINVIRFARIFHLLPKISTLAIQLEESIQMTHTFCNDGSVDPLLCELLGDIFEGCYSHRQKRSHSSNSISSVSGSSYSPSSLDLYDTS